MIESQTYNLIDWTLSLKVIYFKLSAVDGTVWVPKKIIILLTNISKILKHLGLLVYGHLVETQSQGSLTYTN
jgi:hypothetical protein